MKSTLFAMLLVSAAALPARAAQDILPSAPVQLRLLSTEALQYQVADQGPHHRQWVSKDEKGRVLSKFTEIRIGLNRQTDNGAWVEASDEIEVFDKGAILRGAQFQAIFSSDSDHAEGTFDLMLPDKQRVRGQCVGVAYTEAGTGKSVFLGELRNVGGELTGRNEVVYPSTFVGIKADLRYRVQAGSLSQDVILRSQLPSPADFGLDPTLTSLEVWTEILEAKEPAKTALVRSMPSGDQVRDCVLDFGSMQIGAGQAFRVESELGGDTEDSLPVRKDFEKINGMQFLIESVPYQLVEPKLRDLPLPPQASLKPKQSVRSLAALSGSKARSKPVSLALAQSTRPTQNAPRAMVRTAKSSRELAGYVVDFNLSSAYTNFTFQSDSTYYVSGTVTLSGTTTFEGGTVIKYTNANSPKLTIASGGTVAFAKEQWRPVVFASKDDNTVGDNIAGSSGTPSGYYANPALSIGASGLTALSITELRISNAKLGLDISGVASGSASHLLSHAQFVHCEKGVQAATTFLAVRNALFYDVLTNFYGSSSSTSRCEHLTVNKSGSFFNVSSASVLFLTNSLLVNVTNIGTITSVNNITNSSEAAVFQEVGAGRHYLLSDTLRNNGLSTIDATLANDLKVRTTYPPLTGLAPGYFSNNVTLFPSVQRDTDTPDCGFHYDPLDHVLYGVVATNTTLTILPGTVIGTYGPYGFSAWSDSKVIAEGTPDTPIRFCTYHMAQEQATTNWSGGGGSGWIFVSTFQSTTNNTPTHSFKFTDWSVLSGAECSVRGYGANVLASLPISHSVIRGGFLESDQPMLNFTNVLFQRCYVSFYGSDAVNFQNCLFWRGTFDNYFGWTNWYVENCYFDRTAIIDTNVLMAAKNNGFETNQPLFATGLTNLVLTSAMTYSSSTYGNYYQAVTNLVNRGSRFADVAGLYHFTTQSSQTKEASSIVDIGFHYVASAGGVASDGDSDGLPDYLEDANGNGTLDSGETSTSSASDLGLKVLITEPKSNSNVP